MRLWVTPPHADGYPRAHVTSFDLEDLDRLDPTLWGPKLRGHVAESPVSCSDKADAEFQLADPDCFRHQCPRLGKALKCSPVRFLRDDLAPGPFTLELLFADLIDGSCQKYAIERI